MTLTKGKVDYEDSSKLSKPTKSGIRIISEMPTSGILWFVIRKHSSGLKTLTILSLVSYLAYDKVVRFFV